MKCVLKAAFLIKKSYFTWRDLPFFGKKVIFYVGALRFLRQKEYFTWEKLIKSRQHLT